MEIARFLVEQCIKEGLESSCYSFLGEQTTPLMAACYFGIYEAAKDMIQNGDELDHKNVDK